MTNPRPERRPRPRKPKPPADRHLQPEPGYLLAKDVADLLGVTAYHLVAHRRTTYAWLPEPYTLRTTGSDGLRDHVRALYWPEAETRQAELKRQAKEWKAREAV